MQYISPDDLRILSDRLKIGNKRVNIRVEVDKYVYSPNASTEFDYVQFYTDQKTPELVGGVEDSKNITSVANICSPVKGQSNEQVLSKITSEFKVLSVNGVQRTNPVTGVVSDHQGTDFGYTEGTELVAACDGIVTDVVISSLNYINILHANGVMTRYLHIKNPTVRQGSKVTQGQVIAEVGAKDAYSTAPHLHFEVRVNAKKDDIGEPRDPVDYLKRKSSVIGVYSKEVNGTGTVTASSLNIRKSPSYNGEIIGTVSEGATCELVSKYGEWYQITYNNITGYSYSEYISVDEDVGGESEVIPSNRGGGNPSYQEIYNFVRGKCNSLGIDPQAYYASLWIESNWTQWYENGGIKEDGQWHNEGDYVRSGANAVGMGQVHIPAWQDVYDPNKLKNDWKYNLTAGVTIFQSCYKKAKTLFSDATSIARASWCAYNTGSNYTRWRDNPNNDDLKYCEYYKKSPWSRYIVGSGGGVTYGIVTSGIAAVRSETEYTQDSVIVNVNKGMSLESLGLNGEWYNVKLTDGRTGFIHKNDFKPMSDALSTDFEVTKVFSEDFEKYLPFNILSGKYVQDRSKKWVIGNDGISNIVTIEGGALESNHFEFVIDVNNSGRLDFYYQCDLYDGSYFNVYDNDKIIFSKTGKIEDYQAVSLPLNGGTHAIKFIRVKGSEGIDLIKIDNINVYSYTYIPKSETSQGLAEVSNNASYKDTLSIVGEEVNIYSGRDKSSNVLLTVGRGSVFPTDSYIPSQWANVFIRNNDGTFTEGFVEYDSSIEITEGGYLENQFSIKTGGFIFDKTLVLDNIISVNIDYKYDMRSADASIVIDNRNGYYSPTYKPMNFPEKGVQLSPFVDYYEGNTLGVLEDNTPIRIYIGYGDNPPRKFTGLIDTVDEDGESQTLTIRCSDMIKKLNNYITYEDLAYPPNGDTQHAWIVSSVIHDLAVKGGMTTWKQVNEDFNHPDILVEETYYTDVNPLTGYVTKMDEYGMPQEVPIEKLAVEEGYSNPYVFINKIIKKGTCIADEIDEMCQNINYWQRCDYYGTYRCTPVVVDELPSAYFRDTENIISLNRTIDYSKCKNHIIVVGGGSEEHFFDNDIWRSVKGERRTCQISVPWADTYGKKKAVATKMFEDMKRTSRTLQVAIEGNPYLELLDTIWVEHTRSTTKDKFIVKGIRDSWNVNSGYVSVLDLFWVNNV